MEKLVLSASQLGERCLRKLWFLSRGYEEKIPEEKRRIFDIGRALEPVVIEWLRREGREVFYNQKGHEDEPDFKIPVGKNGEIWGRFDAVLMDEGMLVDVKTCGDKLFSELLEGRIPQRYEVQLNIYFFGVKIFGEVVPEEVRNAIKRIGIVGMHKGSGKIEIVEVKIQLKVFIDSVLKAKRIFELDNPFSIGWEEAGGIVECVQCGFREICELGVIV